MIDDRRLARAVRERARPRAEQLIGLHMQLADDLQLLQRLATAILDDATQPLGDLVDPADDGLWGFSRSDFLSYTGLVAGLLRISTRYQAALERLKVRPLASCMRPYTPSDEPVVTIVDALRLRIRPLATQIHRLRYLFEQDAVLLQGLLPGLPYDQELIAEYRDDGVAAVTVADVRALLAFELECLAPETLTGNVKRAIVAANQEPLF